MSFKSRVVTSSLFASGMLIASILLPFIPCKKVPNVPNPIATYSTCTLNPDVAQTFDSMVYYFGYAQQLTTAYFVVLFGSFFISMAVLTFLSMKRK